MRGGGGKRKRNGTLMPANNIPRHEQRRAALIARDSWMSPVQPRISKYLNADVADPKEFNTNSNGNSNYENNSDSNENGNNDEEYEPIEQYEPNPPPPKKSTDKYADKAARAHYGR